MQRSNDFNSANELMLWHKLLKKAPGFLEIKDNFLIQETINRDGKISMSQIPFSIHHGRVIVDWSGEELINP